MTLPARSVPHVTVREEDGEVRLLVVRAQGLLGRVIAEYRTVSLTAFSPEDYQVKSLNPFEAVHTLVEHTQSPSRIARGLALYMQLIKQGKEALMV